MRSRRRLFQRRQLRRRLRYRPHQRARHSNKSRRQTVGPLFTAAYLHNPKPEYPALSRRMGEQGLVLLRVFVAASGEARTVELKQGCRYPRLDEAALDAVRRWKFVPARRGEQSVDAWVVVPIRFSLKG